MNSKVLTRFLCCLLAFVAGTAAVCVPEVAQARVDMTIDLEGDPGDGNGVDSKRSSGSGGSSWTPPSESAVLDIEFAPRIVIVEARTFGGTTVILIPVIDVLREGDE